MKKNNQDNFNVFFTRLVIFTAIALLVFVLVLVVIGITSNGEEPPVIPDETTEAQNTTEPPEDTTRSPETTNTPETTKPQETTKAPESTPAPETTTSPNIDPSVPNSVVDWDKFNNSTATLKETDDMGQEYINKIIFLGDSTTNGLRAYKVLADGENTKQVWTGASGSLTLDNSIMSRKIYYPDMAKEVTIVEAVKDKKPEMMIITLGVNGIRFSTEEQFKNNYSKLIAGIKEASPDTEIILQSIFPVTKSYTKITNDQIRAANEWILFVAEKHGLKFLNTTIVLQDAEGCLIEKYCNDGALHLNETGLLTELQYIRTHGFTK